MSQSVSPVHLHQQMSGENAQQVTWPQHAICFLSSPAQVLHPYQSRFLLFSAVVLSGVCPHGNTCVCVAGPVCRCVCGVQPRHGIPSAEDGQKWKSVRTICRSAPGPEDRHLLVSAHLSLLHVCLSGANFPLKVNKILSQPIICVNVFHVLRVDTPVSLTFN